MTSDDLGPGVILGVNDSALLVVDLLLLLVAQQEDDGAEEEDGRAPANAVGPSELPQGAVSKFKFLHEETGYRMRATKMAISARVMTQTAMR